MRDAMKTKKSLALVASTLLLATMLGRAAAPGVAKSFVYMGTCAGGGGSEGSYRCESEDANSIPTPAGSARISTNPSFFVLHPMKNLRSACGEITDFLNLRSGQAAATRCRLVSPMSGLDPHRKAGPRTDSSSS